MKHLFSGPRPWLLHELSLPAQLCVLSLAPHPDDFDAVGVAMRFLRDNGNVIYLAVLTSASGVEDSFCTPPTPARKAAVRQQEQRDSCAFFGLPTDRLAFLDLDEDDGGGVAETEANFEAVARHFQSVQADLVFLPHGHDPHQGHQWTAATLERLAASAGRPLAAWLNRDPKTIGMRPDVYCVFGPEEASWKGELLRCHRSQHQRNLNTRGHGFDERILQNNRSIAAESGLGVEYAEAFELRFWA